MNSSSRDDGTIILRARDGEKVRASAQALMKSDVLEHMLQVCNALEDEIPLPIPLAALEQIVIWCERHKDDQGIQPEECSFAAWRKTSKWDRTFCKTMDWEKSVNVYHGAHFLNLGQLSELMSFRIAGLLEGLTQAELIERIGIPCDYDDKEKSNIIEALKPFIPAEMSGPSTRHKKKKRCHV